MQQMGGGGGGGRVFYQCENKQERYIYIEFEFVRIFHKVWDIGTKYMTYFSRAVRNRYKFFTV